MNPKTRRPKFVVSEHPRNGYKVRESYEGSIGNNQSEETMRHDGPGKIGFIYPSGPLTQELSDILSDELKSLGFESRRLDTVGCCQQDLRMVVLFGIVPYVPGIAAMLECLYDRAIPVLLWEIEPLPPAALSEKAMVDTRRLSRPLDKKGIFRVGEIRHFVVKLLTARLRRHTFHQLEGRYGPFPDDRVRFMCRIYQWTHDAHASGRIQKILVSVRSRSDVLRQAGIAAGVQPAGYHSLFGHRQTGVSRDIDVLFLGHVTPQRAAAIHRIETRLRAAGYHLRIESGGFHGENRTCLLNRTRIVLNVLRCPWEFPGMRLLMAMGCGALVVSDCAPDTHPYRPGEHFIMAERDRLADTLIYYLEHEDEARRIADQGHRFITQELTMRDTIAEALVQYAENPA